MSYLTRKPLTQVLVDDIKPSLDRYLIDVRIIRLYSNFRNKKVTSIEMILVDRMGTRIHATVEEALVAKYSKHLIEDGCVNLSNFSFVDYTSDYKTNPLAFKIQFHRRTVVVPCADFPADLPEKYFAKFADIVNGALDRSVLVDVLGQVVSVGSLEDVMVRGKKIPKFNIYLRDILDERLTCTFWNDYAIDFSQYFVTNKGKDVVCLIRFAMMREWNGNISLSNSLNVTRVIYDPRSSAVDAFKECLPKDNLVITKIENRQLSFFSSSSLHDEFLIKNKKSPIDAILRSTEVGKFVTAVIINDIEMPRWYYIGCNRCKKKVEPCEDLPGYDGPPLFDCLECKKDVSDVSARYRIVVHVSDFNGDQARFIFFDGVAEVFLGVSASNLAEQHYGADPDTLPLPLSCLIGREYLFKIGVGADNLKSKKVPYIVDLISDSQDWIDAYHDDVKMYDSPSGSRIRP